MSAAEDTGLQKSSIDLNLASAQDGTASFQQAPTLPNSSPSAIRASKRKRAPLHKHDPSVPIPLAIMPAPSANATQQGQNLAAVAAGSRVIGVNPEVVMIQVGEDVTKKIMSFSGNGWEVRILSTHGAVSNVTLRQGTSSHETLIYEGYFEILSLSGSYQPSEINGMRGHTGGLCVSLASPNGSVFGGLVAGALTAASPIQVLIGRFPVDDKNNLKRGATSGIPGASSSTGALDGSSDRPGSPLNQSASGSFSTSSNPVVSNIP